MTDVVFVGCWASQVWAFGRLVLCPVAEIGPVSLTFFIRKCRKVTNLFAHNHHSSHPNTCLFLNPAALAKRISTLGLLTAKMERREPQSPAQPHSGADSPQGPDTQKETLVSIPGEPDGQLPPSSLVITGWASFTESDEYYDREPVDGEMVFSHTILLILDPSDGTAYFGRVNIPLRDLSIDQARNSLRRIPDVEVYPPLPTDWSTLERAASGPEHHLKRPRFASYSWAKGTKQAAERFLEEGRTLHLMRQNPHPNVAKLEGCLVSHGRILALLVKRYPIDLDGRVEGKQRKDRKPVDKTACFAAIVSAVKHFHSLGIAHNDINPSNIMLDDEDHPIVADFGGCRPFGEDLVELGTPGWNDGFDPGVSAASNDLIGLRKIGE